MRGLIASSVVVAALAGCGGGGVVGASCSVDGECPVHQLCDGARCVSGCLSHAECSGKRCGDHGRCAGKLDDGDDGDAGGPAMHDLAGGDFSVVDLARLPDLSGAVDLAVVDAWICTGACPDAALEPNDTAAKATVESDPVTLPSLALCPRNDVDFFKITASKKGTLTATLTLGPCGPLLAVDVLAADGTTVAGASAPTSAGAVASAAVNKNDVRYVRVTPRTAGDQNLYALHLAVE